ncbi:hypothetical protein [Streptomyces phaeochromogenes]|uniref:hypothetical protein n=1 Tax=Streptomyces phaeochromogenes TaxID=1923 RepID=UPI003713D0C6
MTYTVDLALDVEEALAALSDDDRQEVMELIAAALVDPNSWPTLGGWDWTLRSGSRLWVVFAAYLDGIGIVAFGANDELAQAAWPGLRPTAAGAVATQRG